MNSITDRETKIIKLFQGNYFPQTLNHKCCHIEISYFPHQFLVKFWHARQCSHNLSSVIFFLFLSLSPHNSFYYISLNWYKVIFVSPPHLYQSWINPTLWFCSYISTCCLLLEEKQNKKYTESLALWNPFSNVSYLFKVVSQYFTSLGQLTFPFSLVALISN